MIDSASTSHAPSPSGARNSRTQRWTAKPAAPRTSAATNANRKCVDPSGTKCDASAKSAQTPPLLSYAAQPTPRATRRSSCQTEVDPAPARATPKGAANETTAPPRASQLGPEVPPSAAGGGSITLIRRDHACPL